VKRVLLIGAAAFGMLLALGGFVVWRALRAVGTPEFQRSLLAEARARLGTDVQVQSMQVSILHGFRLRGVKIKNPAGLPGDLLTADSFALGYDLWPLLRGRLQIDELSVIAPVIRIVSDTRGSYNYEHLKAYEASASSKAAPSAGASSTFVQEIVVKRLTVKDANLGLAEGKKTFMRLEGMSFASRLALGGAETGGEGQARIALLGLAESLFLRAIDSKVAVSRKGLRLEPVKARLADGRVAGKIRLDLQPDLFWSMDLEVHDASVATLLKEAGFAPTTSGSLAAVAALSGSGGMATARGKGKAEVASCKVSGHPVFTALSAVLQLPELQAPRFDECRMQFEVGGGVVRTTVLSLKGPSLELMGKGTYGLATSSLDYDMTLGLSKELLSRIPGNTTRAAFKRRDDGFGTLEFGVTGSAAAPKVDLLARFGASVATEAAKEGLRKLFGKKKNP
jgi:hypothetical protein